MSEAEMQRFLAQFDKASENIKTWPQWMRDASYVAAATFPKLGAPSAPSGGQREC